MLRRRHTCRHLLHLPSWIDSGASPGYAAILHHRTQKNFISFVAATDLYEVFPLHWTQLQMARSPSWAALETEQI